MHQFCPKIVLMLQSWCRWCKGNFWGTCDAISLACTFSSCITHKSVRGHAINAQKHYLPYEMFLNRTFSLAPYMICMQFVLYIYFFLGKLSLSCQSSSPAIWDFSVVILVEQKGRGDSHSDWVGSKCRNQPSQKWSLFHFIIQEQSQSGIDLNWTNLVLNQVGLVRRLKCFILLFICVCQIKPGTFLWGSFYQDGQFKHILTYNIP